ncbi:MAG: electron transfer flavoprotein subunit beta/FixA family protein [Bifidobacteriaceae bacterium]|jgi:electron transfer flavoprotein beta subunit|nr:electron transfer flavoprotein subunit beta/FixA family protein [Bifidobacteriaceae bacterium]
METVVACYKWVVDEADIRVRADGSVDFSRAQGRISEYDKNAIELAVQLAGQAGAKAVGLTFGPEKTRKSLKDALSRGLDELCWVKSEASDGFDGAVTARALAAGAKTLVGVGLVICAEGSSDGYSRQVGPRLGALLGWPVITSACEVALSEGTVTGVRRLEDVLETVRVEGPAVVAVLPEVNRPPLPGLKAVMAAGRKPVVEVTAGELGVNLSPRAVVVGQEGYAQERKKLMIEGESLASTAAELVSRLRQDGVI